MFRSENHVARNALLVKVAALATFLGGVMNLFALIEPHWFQHHRLFEDIFPIEFWRASRMIELVIGFTLIIASINIFRRKRRAWELVTALAAVSLLFHIVRRIDPLQIITAGLLLLVLIMTRGLFTVRSEAPDLRRALMTLAAILAAEVGYGIAGFWFLDTRDFGREFHLSDAIRETINNLLLNLNPGLTPLTHHARWFLDSLDVVFYSSLAVIVITLFRPVVYQFHTRSHDRATAEELVRRFGGSALDFFKTWPDKSYFFANHQQGFVAYRVGRSVAVALGDPVASPDRLEETVQDFVAFCRDNDWLVAFHQATPGAMPAYERAALHKLKIGDDAIVNLPEFSLDGKSRKRIRNVVHKLESTGIGFRRYEPPLPDDILNEAHEVSNGWLAYGGRRERRFTLGYFEPTYVRNTPLFAAHDTSGRLIAFANEIPSYLKGEATIDLMRHRPEAAGGIMEFLFVKMFEYFRERGFTRFNMGMAPMAGFQDRESASREERAVHFFFQHLNAFFRFQGLRQFKAKFASDWEPRYLIYRNVLNLPAIALALNHISEFRNR